MFGMCLDSGDCCIIFTLVKAIKRLQSLNQQNHYPMNLQEIIKANDKPKNSVLIELILRYKNSLLTYYSDEFRCDPVLMVVSIMNAVQYAKIVPASEFSEAIEDWVEQDDSLTSEEQ